MTDPGIRSISGLSVSTVDLVTAEIRRAILNGTLPPGEPFSIRDLTRRLGVSHIPIRESLRRLESQGLIVLRQAQGGSVSSLTAEDMDSIYKLRLQLEPPLAAASVPLHSEEQFAKLHQWLELSRDPDPEVAWQGQHDFHKGLVSPAASEWDLRILGFLWTAAERYTHLVFDPTTIDEAERDRRYRMHADLLEAAVEQDQERMRQRLVAHFTLNEDQIRERIEELDSIVARRAARD